MEGENSKATMYVVAGVVALVVLSKLSGMFRSIGSTIGLGPRPQGAVDFDNPQVFPVLWQTAPLTTALLSGSLSIAEMDAQGRPYAATIDAARVLYYQAKGLVDDDEGDAVSAFASLPNYVCLLVMAESFYANYGTTLGAYGLTFLGDGEKAQIAQIISSLTP